ncbi:unnamed protein product [Sphagnum jensenii]|uniref:Uncharacterized protein n=1 Tax=Sphagnum jensenii TaxID=128206 RepID=A0ABP1B4T2_9BRYO
MLPQTHDIAQISANEKGAGDSLELGSTSATVLTRPSVSVPPRSMTALSAFRSPIEVGHREVSHGGTERTTTFDRTELGIVLTKEMLDDYGKPPSETTPENQSNCNMEVMNDGDNENGDDYSSDMGEPQVEDTDFERENASEGNVSEPNTILQPNGIPSTCFMLVSSSWVMHEVVKLVVNVLQCKYMVNTIVTSKCYLMGETCGTLAAPIYKELFRITKKADLIVQECSEEPLNLKSILAEMDNICGFVAVIVDWQSCTRLFRKDIDNWTWASVRSRLEPLKALDIEKNKELWDPQIAKLRQLMSDGGGSRTGERINFADYLQRKVQNDLAQGLLPWCNLASDLEAKRGEFLGLGSFGSVSQYTFFGMACAEKSFNALLDHEKIRDFENEVGVMEYLKLGGFIACPSC